MPIDLRNLAAGPAPQVVSPSSPKFFDRTKLTGTGKETGLLSKFANPAVANEPMTTPTECVEGKRVHYTNNSNEVWRWPVNPLTDEAWDKDVSEVEIITSWRRAPLAYIETENGNVRGNLYVSMMPHALLLEEKRTPGNTRGNIQRTFTPSYQIFVWWIPENCSDTHAGADRFYGRPISWASQSAHRAKVSWKFTARPKHAIEQLLREIHEDEQSRNGRWSSSYEKCTVIIKRPEVESWLSNYSLYNMLCERAREWTEDLDKYINILLDEYVSAEDEGESHYALAGRLTRLGRVFRRYEAYSVPLESYKSIYQSVSDKLASSSEFPEAVSFLAKQNLNLLLADTLQQLSDNKDKLPHIASNGAKGDKFFSRKQRDAIESTEPLVMVQSGAGSGKSSTIRGRIKFLLDAGVTPSDIMVISFTNAAADHISEIAPDVHSMTMAKMIHEIYSTNYPNHELSSIQTLINSVDIYLDPMDEFTVDFRHKLKNLSFTDKNATTKMNNFVEANFDKVIEALDIIGQTTLELEIIICYQMIDSLIEPDTIASKHLIVDEVQDNSVFEFIYTLKYIAKHLETLFVVGDSSQTLYEFRSANPTALNVLENSGIFKTYKLDINYRSNQEILDFANVTLADIEANRFANIQLQSHDFRNADNPVTCDTFKNRVKVVATQASNRQEVRDKLPELLTTEFVPWAQDIINRDEKICILAYSRDDVMRLQQAVEALFPAETTVSLVPEKQFNNTAFSEYIRRYWNDVQFVPKKSLSADIRAEIINRLPILVSNVKNSRPVVEEMLNDWDANYYELIRQWIAQYEMGIIDEDTLLVRVRDSLLHTEISHNAERQSVLAQRNAAQKEAAADSNARFFFSTIHSAKGLEFDNVCLLYQGGNFEKSEENKRMYYVALTRAMNSELILAFDDRKHAHIMDNYDQVIDTITRKSIAQKYANLLDD